MSPVTQFDDDAIEIRPVSPPPPANEEAACLQAQVGTFDTDAGSFSGVSVEAFGFYAPLLSANEARRFAKWLLRAADLLDGSRRHQDRKGQKKRRYDEDDD